MRLKKIMDLYIKNVPIRFLSNWDGDVFSEPRTKKKFDYIYHRVWHLNQPQFIRFINECRLGRSGKKLPMRIIDVFNNQKRDLSEVFISAKIIDDENDKSWSPINDRPV